MTRTPVTLLTSVVVGSRDPSYTGPHPNVVILTTGGFPYTIPAGHWFELTRLQLVNKYPWDKPTRDPSSGLMVDKRAQMYFQTSILSVAAHDPSQYYSDPPIRYPRFGLSSGGHKITGKIVNNQSEEQNCYALAQGYLCSEDGA